MLLFELESFPLEQVTDLEALERRIGMWATARTYSYRLFAQSRSFDMREPCNQLRRRRRSLGHFRDLRDAFMAPLYRLLHGDQSTLTTLPQRVARLSTPARTTLSRLMADTPVVLEAPEAAEVTDWLLLGERIEQQTWGLPVLRDLERSYEELAKGNLRSATYILVVWPPAEVQPLEIMASLRAATRHDVRQIEHMPSVLTSAVQVREDQALFIPIDPGGSYLSVLRAHAITGEIDGWLLHALMSLPFDVTVAVDVDTLPPAAARRAAEFAYQAARAATMDARVKDTRSEDKMVDAELVMRELRTQSLHSVQVAVLVSGESAEEVRQRRAVVRDLFGSTIRFEAVRGSQAALLKLFSTTPASQIDAAWGRSVMLSHGVGCLFGVVGYHRASATDGPLWGLDAVRSAPLFYDPFAGGKAGHMLVLGQTGSGKTFFLNLMTLRAAAAQGWRVVWIDSNENGPRIQRACRDGVRRHEIGLSTTLNLMEPVFGPRDGLTWRHSQVEYVISSLGLLMGTPESSGVEARGLTARAFTSGERGYLERALLALYDEVPDEPGEEDANPILTDLILALEELDEPGAAGIARELRLLLFGSETRMDTHTLRGQCFNGHTSASWEIDSDIVFFDLTQSDATGKSLLPFFYAQIIGFVYRHMRDRNRDRARPTLLIIDEFGLASRIEAVGQLAETITRVARKYKLALALADQTPDTFLDRDYGKVIFANSPVKFIFHLDEVPAQRIGAGLPDLTPGHIEFIRDAEQGTCVAVFGSTVTPMYVHATEQEYKLLSGS